MRGRAAPPHPRIYRVPPREKKQQQAQVYVRKIYLYIYAYISTV